MTETKYAIILKVDNKIVHGPHNCLGKVFTTEHIFNTKAEADEFHAWSILHGAPDTVEIKEVTITYA